MEKLRSSSLSFCITYLQYRVLWEQTTVYQEAPERETERETESARVSVGLRGGWIASILWPSQMAPNRSQQEDIEI